MTWGIRVASRKAVEKHGENADDALIWTNLYRYERDPFKTEEEALKYCKVLDDHSDGGKLVHRPIEFR